MYAKNQSENNGLNISGRHNSELQRAKIIADERQLHKSESLGRMAGAVAHHFNNQLTTVLGNIDLAMRTIPPGSSSNKFLAEAIQAAHRAAEVSTQMLAYLGQPSGERTLLNLCDLYRQNIPLLQSTLPAVLETDFAAPGPVISANAIQVQQVLFNLVTNAREAIGTDNGAIRVSVKTVPSSALTSLYYYPVDWCPQAAAYACLEVKDTGCGIAPADLDNIFDPFFTRKRVGRGMGLSVVLGIVRVHCGTITVESDPGRGSTFRVYFPLAADAPIRKELSEPQELDFGGGTVLVVDDEEPLLKFVATTLRDFGFTVLTAPDGITALEIFQQHLREIRCVLCDLTMPRMNGWQTIKALRRLSPGIPVILASGFNESSVMAGAHEEQPQLFLSKPYNRVQLREVIGAVLSLHSENQGSFA